MTTAIHPDADEPVLLTDAELTALALAADPDQPLALDAVPLTDPDASPSGLLPAWYMPAPVTYPRARRHKVAAVLIISGFVVINLLGLCITYGQLTAG